MTRVYPIFTDGEKFIHSSDLKVSDNKSRTAYFSEYDFEEWKKIEEPTLTKEKAKMIFERWENQK